MSAHEHVWEKMTADEAYPAPAGIRCACGRYILGVTLDGCFDVVRRASSQPLGMP